MKACAFPNVRAIARTAVLAAAVLVVLGVAPVRPALAAPAGTIDAMRGPTPLDEEGRPPPLGNAENKDVRRNRAFPMQPPTVRKPRLK